MTKLSKSLEKISTQRQNHINRCLSRGIDPSDYLKFLDNWEEMRVNTESDPEWKKNNLEYDLRTSEWMLNKVRLSDEYAHKLYATLCNNEFIKRELWPILKDEKWSCSWRYAGGIIADMREAGDYIEWYCGGDEGQVFEEIEEDLHRLGWIVASS